MSKGKKILCYGLIFMVLCVSFFLIAPPDSKSNTLTIYATFLESDEFQLFYSDGSPFSEEDSFKLRTSTLSDSYTFSVPSNSLEYRLDFGTMPYNAVLVEKIVLEKGGYAHTLSSDAWNQLLITVEPNYHELYYALEDSHINFRFLGNDPFIQLSQEELMAHSHRALDSSPVYLLYVLLSFVVTLVLYKFVYLKDVLYFIKNIYQSRTLLFSLASNDFKVKYAGSYLGFVWAFIQPVCTILVFWFVFQIGFKSAPVIEVPFALWLASGLIPWFYFADSFSGATGTFFEYNYLVKKVVFKVEILPIVKIVAALYVHLFFIGFVLFLFVINGVSLTSDLFYLGYYVLCTTYLVIGLSFFTSAVVIFFKDLAQIIGICLQFGMWLTPIMWDKAIFSDQIIQILKINPMFYVVDGYRNAFLGTSTFDLSYTVYFWVVSTFVFLFGMSLFRRLKVHFADVL